ncbi:hypothetical protein [Variovorax sp. LjRoot178]|uniref:hypothetical protein n=1 Tax=Variovorax sp. LjRoot178 TaxID=3342277 RepID=UPI003F50D88A
MAEKQLWRRIEHYVQQAYARPHMNEVEGLDPALGQVTSSLVRSLSPDSFAF